MFRDFTVIKYPRVLQSLFYFLSIERESICEPRTNKLKWKLAKSQIDPESTLIEKLAAYEPLGPKEDDYRFYTTLNFIEKNIE